MSNLGIPKVSIIVPVYNTEKYLERCLDSILIQTLPSFEVICINDGSIDNSLQILNIYSKKDPRIKVITQERQGAAIARQKGILQSKGEYIGFVDSDDWIHPEMYEKMVQEAEQGEYDLVICDYYISALGNLKHMKSYSGSRLTVEEFMDISAPPFLCIKLFRKDLKPYMEHPVGRSQAEDVGLLYSVLPHVKHLGYIPEAYYYYFQRDNSSSNSDNFVENYCIDDYFYALRELFQMDYGIYNQNAYRHFIQMIYYGLKSPARVYFKAEYIEFLQEVAPYIVGNPKMKCFQDLTQYLCCQTIPAVLYVIDNPLSLPHENVCLESRKHYAPHCKIINLTDSYIENIPVIVQEAMEKKNYKFVHEYLALRHIYSYGGMFIGTNIKLNKPIGEMRTYSAFLGYANGDQINSSFWGAVQRHPLVAYVLNTYESDSITNQMDVSLSDRFYFVLCKEYGLLQKNMGQQNLRDNVVVFRCDKLSFKLDDKNVSQIYYEETFLADRKGLLSVPQEILDFIISETVKKREGELKKKNSNSSSETDYYKKEVERLKNSRSWKITRPLRKIFNFFRKVKYSSMEID